jgi:hypothetical protein
MVIRYSIKRLIYVHPLTDAGRPTLEARSRSLAAFILRRCQIVLFSKEVKVPDVRPRTGTNRQNELPNHNPLLWKVDGCTTGASRSRLRQERRPTPSSRPRRTRWPRRSWGVPCSWRSEDERNSERYRACRRGVVQVPARFILAYLR